MDLDTCRAGHARRLRGQPAIAAIAIFCIRETPLRSSITTTTDEPSLVRGNESVESIGSEVLERRDNDLVSVDIW